jgi:hypothetical protein
MPEQSRRDKTALPAHPDRIDHAEQRQDGSRRGGIVIAALVGGLLLLIVVLHLTGIVGPGAH